MVQQLAVSAERCISQASERGCRDMGSKCAWAAADGAAGTPAYCGVAPMYIMMSLLAGPLQIAATT